MPTRLPGIDLLRSLISGVEKQTSLFQGIEDRIRALERAPQNTVEGPRTFQGRPVVKVMWNGEEVEAVQGLVAYRRRQERSPMPRESAERGLNALVLDTSAPDELGIGVIATDEHIEAERATSAAAEMGADVIWTEPVFLDYGTLIPNDPFFSQQWAFPEINAPQGWDLWNGDPNRVVLAILDSGISIESGKLSHPDLSDEQRIFLGRDFVNNDSEPKDDHGHGTHVAGIAGATKNNVTGVAGLWPGSIFILKVFNASNDGSNIAFEKAVTSAVEFASQQGARLVINYSGGGPDSQTKRAAVAHANDNGALIVAAAGNASGGRIIFPAAYSIEFPNVIAVGAIDPQRQRPSFASQGSEMTVVAPGVNILSTLPNYFVTLNSQGKQPKFDRLNGTSQAAPLVAALGALIWSQWPHLSATEVRDKIVQTAVRIPGSDSDFGSGIIDAEAALM
jgi:subtilisin family serine protease